MLLLSSPDIHIPHASIHLPVAHQVRGANTALLPSPSRESERCFRFRCRSGLPSPPSGPSQPHGRARQARRRVSAGAAGQARPGGTREPTASPSSPPPPGLPRPGTRFSSPRPRLPLSPGRAEPRPLRAATHRRPCGSAPPRLRPARAAGGRGKGASPREEPSRVGNMAASSRAQVLRLYRALLRESQRFSSYNYRCAEGLRGAVDAGLPPRRGVPALLGAGARASCGLGRSRAVPWSYSGTGNGPGPGLERREWAAPGPSARPGTAAKAPGYGLLGRRDRAEIVPT